MLAAIAEFEHDLTRPAIGTMVPPRVVQEIEAAAGSPMGELTERETRDLKPHLAEATDAVREAVADVAEPERPAVAAAAVTAVGDAR